ncbi:MAG: heterodisulfide reductase-related iron-sulfur binding cluster [Pseudomonadota bacterium]|nr:heterodisulfide reductase-related iron-sulfur binding cluster [Pseudomonadota bacterium]
MEGGLRAPERNPHGFDQPDYLDEAKFEVEARRVFDICHGCRRCFNLCASFPRLFDLVDSNETGEIDGVATSDFAEVMDACTLCDMCFMVTCPYVPPHEFNLDFPHLVIRYRAIQNSKGFGSIIDRELAKTDRNARIAMPVRWIVNWFTRTSNKTTRLILEWLTSIHREASLPKYFGRSLAVGAKGEELSVNTAAPAFGRKVVIFSTCFVNYNNPRLLSLFRRVLALNGVDSKLVYPGCCGMPQLERGDLGVVGASARRITRELAGWIEKGYSVVALVPSCALMLKFEWPLILPDDPAIRLVSANTADLSEYIVDIAKNEGLGVELETIDEDVTLQLACHARAQNMGMKGAEMLRLIPSLGLTVVERCSGHGGLWGVKRANFETAIKTGRSAARQVMQKDSSFVASECPLAGDHLRQGIEKLQSDKARQGDFGHPLELFAKACGVMEVN